MNATTCRGKRAFTLIELLVVMMILTILMGFIIPRFLNAKTKAQITRAKYEVKQLEMAWKAYLDEYKAWPALVDDKELPMSGDLVDIISGRPTSLTPDPNPNRIEFFELAKGSTNELRDPWNGLYNVKFDHDYDGEVKVPSEAGGSGESVRRRVLVWTTYTNESHITQVVKSWE